MYILSAFNILRDLFELIVSDVAICDHLAPLCLDSDEAEHHGRKQVVEQSCLPHGNQEADRGQGYLEGYPLQGHNFQPLGATS
jgi:hypothetical protein